MKTNKKMNKKISKKLVITLMVVASFFICTTVGYATSDPLTIINNLTEYLFGIIKGIGFICMAFGLVQVALSINTHDPSQRLTGFMALAGGAIIFGTKEILNVLIGG